MPDVRGYGEEEKGLSKPHDIPRLYLVTDEGGLFNILPSPLLGGDSRYFRKGWKEGMRDGGGNGEVDGGSRGKV